MMVGCALQVRGGSCMNTSAGYQQYEKNKILTASPAELTLMLYDGAIKYANIAIMAIDKGDVEKVVFTRL